MRLDEDSAISMTAARRLCCDAGIVPTLEDAEGRVLDVGRKTRVISPALRRALNRRDAHTCLPNYYGDRMDYDLALYRLAELG